MNNNRTQIANRRTFQAINGLNALPMLEFVCWELVLTSKIRHSSVGWNPVHRIFKHLDGLGPSLRWDDGVISSSLLGTSIETATKYV